MNNIDHNLEIALRRMAEMQAQATQDKLVKKIKRSRQKPDKPFWRRPLKFGVRSGQLSTGTASRSIFNKYLTEDAGRDE
ncbi:MAG TPA: hypothetical protein VH186_01990 [Chloroflexia bacterium]|nr:hypothetical protein [Chloroflexia bacterium]